MDSLKKKLQKPVSAAHADHKGVMPKINPQNAHFDASMVDENVLRKDMDDDRKDMEDTEQRMTAFNADALSNGFKMSVILGEPLGKRMWRYAYKLK